jgi:Methyltransferase domain
MENDTVREFALRSFWHLMDRLDALEPPDRQVECPVCGRSAARATFETRTAECRFGGGRLERYVCARCGCIFGPLKFLRLPPELVDLDYRLLYSRYAEGDSTESEIRAFRSLNPQHGRSYLNWGSGQWSRSIDLLRSEGFDVWGYEPNAAADKPFVVSSREAISPVFDGVYSNNVIEHMLAPVEEFSFLRSILKPGARMAHATPCYRYAYEYTRFHVLFLTGRSPHVLAARSGFRLTGREEDGEFINCIFETA